MLAIFSVANFTVGYFDDHQNNSWICRLAEYVDQFWIGSLFFLLVLGFCQASINSNVSKLAAIFPTSNNKAMQLGQSASMIAAAAANFLIVYYLFAFRKPLDKIENTEGVFEAVGSR